MGRLLMQKRGVIMNNKRKVVVKEVPVYEIEDIPEDMTEEIEKCLAECEAAAQPRKGMLSDLFSKLKR